MTIPLVKSALRVVVCMSMLAQVCPAQPVKGGLDRSGTRGGRHSLPRGLTVEEALLLPTYVPPAGLQLAPPPGTVRALAEFEELEGILISWAYGHRDEIFKNIVDAAQEEGKVWILVLPGTSDSVDIKTYLEASGVPLDNLEFITMETNSLWIRDYGPWSVYDVVTDEMGFVDFRYNRPRPLDDVVPGGLAELWGLPLYQTLEPPDSLAHPGGNFMVDGAGTAFASNLIVEENPSHTTSEIDSILLRYCGVDRFTRLETLLYDRIHHIDMHVKLLDEETVLVGEYPPGMGDYDALERIAELFRTATTCYGRPYRVIRIPMPADAAGRYPPDSDFLTYTNALLVNGTILVPIFALPTDDAALQIYRDAMPGYTVVGIDCNAIIGAGGAIHCITKEVGTREPIHIQHARLRDAPADSEEYPIKAKITVRSGVASAYVGWKTDADSVYNPVEMTESNGEWTATIPRQSGGVQVQYLIEVVAGSGHRVTRPLVGGAGPYTFKVRGTSSVAREGGQVEDFVLAQNFPNPFNPSTTIHFSLGKSGSVSLKVFDMLGREAATLLEQQMPAGKHSIRFDGSAMASGMYVYRLQSGTRTLSRAMLLMR